MSTLEALIEEDSLLNHMEISIVEAEKRSNGPLHLREFYTVYLVETKVTDPVFKSALSTESSLWRRYTDFELLRTYLDIAYPYIVVPSLPEKRVLYAWQKVTTHTFDPDFVDRRRVGLENFLLRVAKHPILSQNEHFMGFLQRRDGWREHIQEISYLRLAESKLKALSVAVRLRKPDKQFETFKNYGIELQNNLCNFLAIRARLVEKQYSLYKLHANYGRVFSEWSGIEKEMGDGLQKSGHYLDSLAATIDITLEDEELIADQLKEWLFGASALQAVVRRREALQVAKDEAKDALISACKQRDRVIEGKAGLMSRLFGSVDTEEVQELKILRLEHRITQQTDIAKQANEDLNKAMVDIKRFQNQKVINLQETLSAYCILQFKLARESLQTWKHIKKCLESIP